MSFFPFMPVESSLVGSFRKLFFCILILFVLISTSLFLVTHLGIVFSIPSDISQNLPKMVKHKTDGRWMVKRVPSEVGASTRGGSSSYRALWTHYYAGGTGSFSTLQASSALVPASWCRQSWATAAHQRNVFFFLACSLRCWRTWRRACATAEPDCINVLPVLLSPHIMSLLFSAFKPGCFSLALWVSMQGVCGIHKMDIYMRNKSLASCYCQHIK